MQKATKQAAKISKGSQKPARGQKAKKTPKAAGKPIGPQNGAQSDQKANGNPYREGGSYWSSVEALKHLGLGKLHAFHKIVPAVREVMQRAGTYKAFASKVVRNEETAEKPLEKILTNVQVVSRKDYGKPLREVGYEVRFSGREKVAGLFKVGK